MRHRHQSRRSFPTTCRYCSKKVLYWECHCGAKAFFNLPIYGKPQRHICDEYLKKQAPKISKWKQPIKEEEKELTEIGKLTIYECPVCGKTFKSENALNTHIKTKKKIDESHQIFFDEILDMIDFEFDDDQNDINESDIAKEKIEMAREKDSGDFQINTDVKLDATFGKVVLRKKKKKRK